MYNIDPAGDSFRRLLREGAFDKSSPLIVKNVSVVTPGTSYDNKTDPFPAQKIKQLFGSFVTIKSGPQRKEGGTAKYTMDVDFGALVELLKSNKKLRVDFLDGRNLLLVFLETAGMSDPYSVYLDIRKIPKEVLDNLRSMSDQQVPSNKLNTITIEIADPVDGFDQNPAEFELPLVVKKLVGPFKEGDYEDDDEESYLQAVDKYVSKIEKALVAVGKKIVPGLKLYSSEDGAITLKLPSKPTSEVEAKLRTLFKGARAIGF